MCRNRENGQFDRSGRFSVKIKISCDRDREHNFAIIKIVDDTLVLPMADPNNNKNITLILLQSATFFTYTINVNVIISAIH